MKQGYASSFASSEVISFYEFSRVTILRFGLIEQSQRMIGGHCGFVLALIWTSRDFHKNWLKPKILEVMPTKLKEGIQQERVYSMIDRVVDILF